MVNLGAYAMSDKSFTLNAHVRERLEVWENFVSND